MRTPADIIGRIRLVYRAFGAKGLIRRIAYVVPLRVSLLRRRLPVRPTFDDEAELRWSFRFDLARVRDEYLSRGVGALVHDRVVADANRLLDGEHALYGDTWLPVGWPPKWLANPTTGTTYPSVHWNSISDDDPALGDIKDVWELSRFGSTFLLARAFALTDDDRYPEAWWAAVESWAAANPPNTGVNWRCAQESSLRAIAWCFGVSTFAGHSSSAPERLSLVARLLGASARRVRPTLGYALSQRNNHAISELVFLLSLPGRPSHRLCRLLREAMDDQFLDDGSYGQQSLVYERLALHVLRWLVAVQPALPTKLRSDIVTTLSASAFHLERCSDSVSGDLCNYGPNDGTNLLALSSAGHLDARPTLELLGRATDDVRSSEPRIWLPANEHVPERPSPAESPASTYVTMRGPRSLLLTRIGAPARRATDADQQAVELFIGGERVVIDPGTFRYSGTAPWRNPFIGVATHSTVRSVAPPNDVSVGRFLRAPMSSAEIVAHEIADDTEVLVSRRAEGDSVFTRAVVRRDDRFVVVDRIDGGDGIVRWNMSASGSLAGEHGLLETVGQGSSAKIEGARVAVLGRADDDPASGWWSPTYASLEPCCSVEVAVDNGATAWARFAPAGLEHLRRSEVETLLEPFMALAGCVRALR